MYTRTLFAKNALCTTQSIEYVTKGTKRRIVPIAAGVVVMLGSRQEQQVSGKKMMVETQIFAS